MEAPARLVPLLRQFDHARTTLLARLQGLTDGEYRWEPVSGCWSVRARGTSRTNRAMGGGPWVMDFQRPEPAPPPLTTIAWRICHLSSMTALRADYTTGSQALTWDDYQMSGTADAALDALSTACGAWRECLTGARDADLDQVGHSQFPWGLDPRLPFLDIVWWMNQEFLHHGGEIALLRDLYRVLPR